MSQNIDFCFIKKYLLIRTLGKSVIGILSLYLLDNIVIKKLIMNVIIRPTLQHGFFQHHSSGSSFADTPTCYQSPPRAFRKRKALRFILPERQIQRNRIGLFSMLSE